MTEFYAIFDRDNNIWNGRHFLGGHPRIFRGPPSDGHVEKAADAYGLGPVRVEQVVVARKEQSFTKDELNLLRQWYNALWDLTRGYLGSQDDALSEKINKALDNGN